MTLSQGSSEFRKRVAVVIPVYNEERSVLHVMEELTESIRSQSILDFIVILINDGSTDGTQELLNQIRSTPQLHIIEFARNRGTGFALRQGFREALNRGAQWIIQLDGDGQHPVSQIPRLLEPLLNYDHDVVVGSRYLPGGSGNVSSWPRRVGTWVLSQWLYLIVGLRIRDTTSGFRAFNSRAAHHLTRRWLGEYPEVETYVHLAREKFRVKEVPILMKRRQGGVSSITFRKGVQYMLRVPFTTLALVLRIRSAP